MKNTFLLLFAFVLFGLNATAQQGMGVGNSNPQEMLDVTGAIKIGTTTTTNAGTIRWNGTNFQGYDGTQWVNLDGAGGADSDWTVSGTNQYSGVSGNVGIGTTSPTAKLDLDGQIRMRTGATTGYVPVSDANGVMTWTDPNTVVTPTVTNTLDAAYDQGGAGAGREIDATDGAVAINGGDGFMVSGTVGSGPLVGAANGISDGPGTRMFFNPNRAAFRAGHVNGTEWDAPNIGSYSVAFGYNNIASGSWSSVMGGGGNTASGFHSTATGNNNTAAGDYSFTAGNLNTTGPGFYAIALGSANSASGQWATAIGGSNVASGMGSTALGLYHTTPSLGEIAMGLFSTTYTATSATSWSATDRLLVLGNGQNPSNRSNALVIYKDGTMNINDAYDMPTADGSAGQVLTTNGSGVTTWQTPGNDGDWTVSGVDQYSTVTGNVGIGTTTPTQKMHVQVDNNGFNLPIYVQNLNGTGGSNGVGIGFYSGASGTQAKAAIFHERAASNNGIGKLHLVVDNVDDNNSVSLAESRLTITPQGNVGISQLNPTAKLDIAGTAALNDNQLRLRDGSDANHYLSYIGGSFDGAKLTGFNNVILNTVSGGDALIVTGNRVGIGTTAPIAPLHVEAQSSPTYGNFTFYAFQANAGGGSCCAGTVNNVSIHASGRVMASEFDAFSDARIKNVISVSNSEEDLKKLLGIEITDYRMKDAAKDMKPYKKVIAQQVEKVYPQAVSTVTDVIPNIYKVSNISSGYIPLQADVEEGDIVKLIFDNGTEMAEVISVGKSGFTVNTETTGDVFVYGKQVDDFRTVDYEAISMLNVSATQELFKMIQSLQNENAQLKSSVNDLKALAGEIEALKQWTNFKSESNK